MDRDVFFSCEEPRIRVSEDGFGIPRPASPGDRWRRAPNWKIKRINIAERLYSITGGGIYRDSVLTGHAVPIAQPLLNGEVLGQDSIQTAVYQGKIYWFWGDTNWPEYTLGNFHMAGATSTPAVRGRARS